MAKKSLTRAQAIKKKKKRKKKAKTATVIGIIVIVLIIAVVAVWFFAFKDKTSQATVDIDGESVVVESQDIGELAGSWESKEESVIWTFDSSGNGVYCMDSDPISFVYIAKDGRLYINFLETTFSDCEFGYSVSGDTLTLKAENGTTGGTYTLTRVD